MRLEERKKTTEPPETDPSRSRKMDITFTDVEFRLIRDCAAEMNITQRDLLRSLIAPALDLLKHVRG